MKFIDTITKENLPKMPQEVFLGRIIVVSSMRGLKKALLYLYSFPVIGFDTETRPSFSKKTHYQTSLIQLATDDTCFLIRLSKFQGIPFLLEAFLKSKQVKKIGLSLRDDFHGLHKLITISSDNFIDLQQYVVQFGIAEMSLQKIYAILFGKRISKRARLTNWDADVLSDAQLKYAALDAWSCLRIYQFLENSK
jgi:ribonuclease D